MHERTTEVGVGVGGIVGEKIFEALKAVSLSLSLGLSGWGERVNGFCCNTHHIYIAYNLALDLVLVYTII